MSQIGNGALAGRSVLNRTVLCHSRYMTLLVIFLAGFFSWSGSSLGASVGGYAGGGIGLAMGKFDKDSFTFKTDDLSRNETTWRIFGGVQLHEFAGIEAGYIDFRKARVTEKVYNDYFETGIGGFDITPFGRITLTKNLSAFARAGVIFWNSDMTSQSAILGTTLNSESGSGLALGAGGNYDIGKWIRLRAEYMRYGVDKAKAGAGDFNILIVSAMFVFTP